MVDNAAIDEYYTQLGRKDKISVVLLNPIYFKK